MNKKVDYAQGVSLVPLLFVRAKVVTTLIASCARYQASCAVSPKETRQCSETLGGQKKLMQSVSREARRHQNAKHPCYPGFFSHSLFGCHEVSALGLFEDGVCASHTPPQRLGQGFANSSPYFSCNSSNLVQLQPQQFNFQLESVTLKYVELHD